MRVFGVLRQHAGHTEIGWTQPLHGDWHRCQRHDAGFDLGTQRVRALRPDAVAGVRKPIEPDDQDGQQMRWAEVRAMLLQGGQKGHWLDGRGWRVGRGPVATDARWWRVFGVRIH